MEIPRAFVCAESKIFDVSEWATCQVSVYLLSVICWSDFICIVSFHLHFQRIMPVEHHLQFQLYMVVLAGNKFSLDPLLENFVINVFVLQKGQVHPSVV
jgi:hypothetical protein